MKIKHFFLAANLLFAAAFVLSCSGKDGADGKSFDCVIYEKYDPKDGYDIICDDEKVGEFSSCYLDDSDDIYFVIKCGGVENAKWPKPVCGTASYNPVNAVCDSRDGKIYAHVKIGEQYWLAENMNYIVNDASSICYENDLKNCSKYGMLYNWDGAENACPAGWRLPSSREWETLIKHADPDYTPSSISSIAAEKLKATGAPENGTDDYGFSALFGGNNSDIGTSAYFWGSTSGTFISISGNAQLYNLSTNNMYSVRCVKDD